MNRRYMVLDVDGVLAWYNSRDAAAPKGKVSLAGAIVTPSTQPGPNQRFGFTVKIPAYHAQQLYFEAQTQVECSEWVSAMSAA